jgi:hypothetical protein
MAVGTYTVSLHGEFAFDDHLAIVGNGDTKPGANITNAFVHDFWGIFSSACLFLRFPPQ